MALFYVPPVIDGIHGLAIIEKYTNLPGIEEVVNVTKIPKTKVQPVSETSGLTTVQLDVINNQLLLCKPNNCTHQYYICGTVGEYQLEHEFPCPVCRSDYDYFKNDEIYRMKIGLGTRDEPNGKPLLACKSCHDVLCPYTGCNHLASAEPLPTQSLN